MYRYKEKKQRTLAPNPDHLTPDQERRVRDIARDHLEMLARAGSGLSMMSEKDRIARIEGIRILNHGMQRLRNYLLVKHLDFIFGQVADYASRNPDISFDDFMDAGMEGAEDAAKYFKFLNGNRFLAYLIPSVDRRLTRLISRTRKLRDHERTHGYSERTFQTPYEQVAEQDEIGYMLEELETLPESERLVLERKFSVQKESLIKIAERTGYSKHSVNKAYHSGLENMHESLSSQD